MIGSHCGQQLVRVSDNQIYFRKKCQGCGRIFQQRKRTGSNRNEVLDRG